MPTTRTTPNQCPSCESTIDSAMDAYGDAAPEPGDLTVCLYCATVCTYTADLTLTLLTDDEFTALPADTRDKLDRVVRTISAHGPGVNP